MGVPRGVRTDDARDGLVIAINSNRLRGEEHSSERADPTKYSDDSKETNKLKKIN